jgi:hypothetical protein
LENNLPLGWEISANVIWGINMEGRREKGRKGKEKGRKGERKREKGK